jgi:aspartate racemase
MSNGCCIGLIGGLGVGATTYYYQELARAHQAHGHSLDIVIVHAETSRVFEFVRAQDPRGLAEYLNRFLRRLQAAGADIGVVPAITPLYCARELATTSPLPLVSMVDAVAAELTSRSARRVAIFGTRYSIQSGFFGQLPNVEFVLPTPDEIDLIHSIYGELLRDGLGSSDQRQVLTELAQTLRDRDQVDAILLAGTDLTLLFNQANTGFPAIDCAALHLQAILNQVLDANVV